MYKSKKRFDNNIILLVDLMVILISLLIAYFLRYQSFRQVIGNEGAVTIAVTILLIYLTVVFLFDSNKDFFRRGYFEEIIAVTKAHILLATGITLILYITKRSSEFSRLVFGYFFAINILSIYVSHLGLKCYFSYVHKKSIYTNRLLLIANANQAASLVRQMKNNKDWRYRIVAIAVIDEDLVGSQIEGVPVVATQDTMVQYVQFNPIDEVLVSASKEELSYLDEAISQFKLMGIVIDINIHILDAMLEGEKSFNELGGLGVITIARNILPYHYLIMKRIMDIMGGLVGIIILGIVGIFVAPAIILDSSGPIIFGQIRVGKNGRQFKFYKFRSMYKDAEERKKQLMQHNEINGLMFKMKDDPRITKVGRFLRKTSLDELPQFINVLKGDMSLVGTRPPTLDEFEKYNPRYKCRLSMTPGLTGLWQISGRSDIQDFEEVLRMDMEYIDNCSLKNDIKILLLTVKAVIITSGSR